MHEFSDVTAAAVTSFHINVKSITSFFYTRMKAIRSKWKRSHSMVTKTELSNSSAAKPTSLGSHMINWFSGASILIFGILGTGAVVTVTLGFARQLYNGINHFAVFELFLWREAVSPMSSATNLPPASVRIKNTFTRATVELPTVCMCQYLH